jgi:hypothetical protein
MKTLKLISIGALLLVSVATLSAQTNLPNPHDDACWSNLAALRACQIQAYDQAVNYAQRCSSYPEYQCNDYYQPQPQKTAAKHASNATSSSNDTAPSAAANSAAASNPNLQVNEAN